MSVREAQTTLQEVQNRVQEAAEGFALGEIPYEVFRALQGPLRASLEDAQNELDDAVAKGQSPLGSPTPAELARRWETMDLVQRRAVVSTLMPKIALRRRGRGSKRLTEDDLVVEFFS